MMEQLTQWDFLVFRLFCRHVQNSLGLLKAALLQLRQLQMIFLLKIKHEHRVLKQSAFVKHAQK